MGAEEVDRDIQRLLQAIQAWQRTAEVALVEQSLIAAKFWLDRTYKEAA